MYSTILKAADKSAAAKKAWLSRARAKEQAAAGKAPAKAPPQATAKPAQTAPAPVAAKPPAPAPAAPAKPLGRADAARKAMTPHVAEMEKMLNEMEVLQSRMRAVGSKMYDVYSNQIHRKDQGYDNNGKIKYQTESTLSVFVQNMREQYRIGEDLKDTRKSIAQAKTLLTKLTD